MYGDEDRDTDEEASSSDISQEGADAVRTTRHQGGFVCVRARACVVVRACVRAYVFACVSPTQPATCACVLIVAGLCV